MITNYPLFETLVAFAIVFSFGFLCAWFTRTPALHTQREVAGHE